MTSTAATSPAPPRGMPARPIHERQLDPEMIRLQRAATVSHLRGQRVDALRTGVAILLAVAGIVTTATGQGSPVMSIIGAGWFLISAFLLKRAAGATARQGALLQEMFDTGLFYLPWHSTAAGDPVADPDVSDLAHRLREGSTRDRRITTGWYDSTEGVHYPYDALIAQEQNLGWDTRLRRRYASLIVAAVIIWSGLGLVAGLAIADTTLVSTLLTFFVPSLSAYQVAQEIWAGQRAIADERDNLLAMVTAELRSAQPGPVSEPEWQRLREVARDIQDGILRTRLDATRVPEWFYRHYRNRDELDFADTAEGHRRRLAA